MRRTLTALLCATLVTAGAVPVAAAGRPAEPVPQVEIGPAYSGDSGPTAANPSGIVQFWRYGGMGKGDEMVVDVTNERPGGAPLSVCLSAGAPTDWTASGSWCSLAPAAQVGAGTTRITLVTTGSTYEGHLAFGDPVTGAGGPYRFTIVSNEHLLEVSGTSAGRKVSRSATLKAYVTMGGEGEYPAPRGTAVTLVVRVGSKSWTRTGTANAEGTARIALRLPKAAVGRARLVLTATADGYLDSAPYAQRVRIT